MVTDIDDRTDGINSGSIGAALSLKGPCRDVATIVFTPDQIDECCLKVENLGEYSKSNAKQLIQCVQIIRQLQEAMKPLKSLEKMCAAIVAHNEPLGAGKERYYVRGDMFRRIKALNPKAI